MTKLSPDPFEYPQFPKRRWRIVGQWKSGGEFLLTLGATQADARARLPEALDEYDAEDRRGIDALWVERWLPGGPGDRPRWKLVCELDPRGWRRGTRIHRERAVR